MGADQQNHLGVCMIRAGSIEPHPELITFAAARRTDVRMRVVTINAPGGQNSFGETILARTADVIHDLRRAIFDDRFANREQR